MAASHCWTLGIGLFPRARGHGVRHPGTPGAGALPVRAHHRAPDRGRHRNRQHRRAEALEWAGFSREGVQRGIRWRGAWRDEVLYSILRTDPAA